MAFYIPRGLGSRFTTFLHSYAQDDGLPFSSALTEEQIQRAAFEEGVHFGAGPNCVFTPQITIWAFVGQYLAGARSCVAAVTRVVVLLLALRREPCSAGTSAYCRARAKLPEKFLRRLTRELGNGVEDQAPSWWRWRDRRTLLVDGFDTILDDTQPNQTIYPQPRSQRPGIGFPMMRVVVFLAFATAVVLDAAMGPYAGKETGETALFRQLLDQVRAEDLVVADRYYCSYFMIALLRQRGADAAFRLHQKRKYDFRRGQRLGHDDHIVVWNRPRRPKWMHVELYAAMPETLRIREVRFTTDTPGFRSDSILVATTLLDHRRYSSADVAELFHQRWHAELDIRSIKQTLSMDMIHCKSPAMARKALWAHLLGYNLVRKVTAQAAWDEDLAPRQISFAGAQQALEAFGWALAACAADDREWYIAVLLFVVATHIVGNRPDRIEPRRRKRRFDRYPNLGMPRQQARQAILNGQD